ncbi:nuclear transport factor 2 family protein [Niabella sp. W65]|nr:nuclear transport factor 2 family protein [Niabella sp. W65]MCH7369336.1 nuclear transport factor 2 family protein [Niabella sp. W65]
MNLPNVIARLVATQNSFDSIGYAQCFSETAVVVDEGKTHQGRPAIEEWIADSNERYRATMKPVGFEEKESESVLKAEVSGNFPGVLLCYRII